MVLLAAGCAPAGAVGLSLAACGTPASNSPGATASASSSSGLTEIPDETNGPYPADGTNGPDILEDSGVIHKDITSSFGTSTTKARVRAEIAARALPFAGGGAAIELPAVSLVASAS